MNMQTAVVEPTPFYSAQESRQSVRAAGGGRQGPLGDEEEEDGMSGCLLRLPHDCALQLEMLPCERDPGAGSAPTDAPAAEREGAAAWGVRSALSVRVLWRPQPGVLVSLDRRYDSEGVLQEAVVGSAIGGPSGRRQR
jgi:hypothetical protein